MLRLVIDGEEHWDSENNKFVYPDRVVVKLEHSLVSLSKWEQRFEKPFLTEEPKTNEELMYYVECMILDNEEPEKVLPLLTQEHIDLIQKHIDSKQTATWFADNSTRRSTQTITNELIYYWLFSAGLDISCQDWHLNRLFTQLRVHSAHAEQANSSGKGKKLTAQDRAARAAENERRRQMYQSKG